jgi:hypothetical protein
MIGWLIAWGVSSVFGAGTTFIACFGLAVFFPRFTQFLFATVVFPVYTLFFGTWAFAIGWFINSWAFNFEAWKTCIGYTAIPVALATIYYAGAVRALGLDRLTSGE